MAENAPLLLCCYLHKYENQPSFSRASMIAQPARRSASATSTARSSMMPEQRNSPPFFSSGRTCGASAMMTSATMFATTIS